MTTYDTVLQWLSKLFLVLPYLFKKPHSDQIKQQLMPMQQHGQPTMPSMVSNHRLQWPQQVELLAQLKAMAKVIKVFVKYLRLCRYQERKLIWFDLLALTLGPAFKKMLLSGPGQFFSKNLKLTAWTQAGAEQTAKNNWLITSTVFLTGDPQAAGQSGQADYSKAWEEYYKKMGIWTVVSVFTYLNQDSLNSHWAFYQILSQVWVFFSTVGLLCSVFSTRLHGLMLMPALFKLLQDLQDWAVDVALPLIIY